MTAGWYDMFLPQMLADYQELRDGGQDVRLRIGAWHHTSQGLARQSLTDAFDWFGTHLLGRTPSAGQPGLRAEVMGGGGWRDLAEWPPRDAAVQRWHLHSGGTLGTGAPAESDSGPLHLRPRRPDARRRRHQQHELRPAGQPRPRAAARRPHLHQRADGRARS